MGNPNRPNNNPKTRELDPIDLALKTAGTPSSVANEQLGSENTQPSVGDGKLKNGGVSSGRIGKRAQKGAMERAQKLLGPSSA